MFQFPPEILRTIFSYLTFKQIVAIQGVSKNLDILTKPYMENPRLWDPLFSILSYMPPYIHVNPLDIMFKKFKSFNAVFNQTLTLIAKEQKKENLTLALIPINETTDSHPTLSELIRFHRYAEEINTNKLLALLKRYEHGYAFSFNQVTRIPHALRQQGSINHLFIQDYISTHRFSFTRTPRVYRTSILKQRYPLIGFTGYIQNYDLERKPLDIAILNEKKEDILEYITQGADINPFDCCPLTNYVYSQPSNTDFIIFLVTECNAQVNAATLNMLLHSPELDSPVFFQNKNKIFQTLKFLSLESHFDINALCFAKGSLLHALLSTRHLHYKIVKKILVFLIEKCGANIHVVNQDGKTPLAIYNKRIKKSETIVNYLINQGAILETPPPCIAENPGIFNLFSNFCNDMRSSLASIEACFKNDDNIELKPLSPSKKFFE